MMKTADARQGPRLAWFGRAWLNRPTRRRRLLQADVRAVFLVIGDIFAPQSPEVLIVEWDYVIKHFTAKTADPALRHSSTLVSVKPDTRRMSCEIATNTMVRRHSWVSHGSAVRAAFGFYGSGKQEWEFSWCSGEKASSDLAVVGGFR